MRKASEILQSARDLITDPKCWMRGAFASDEARRVVSPRDKRAVRWCALGALSFDEPKDTYKAISFLRGVMGKGITTFNDDTTHMAVLSAFDKAITAAEADES